MKKYLIALDVGGSKIDAVLFKEDGKVIKRISAKGGIPFDHGVKITLENCFAAIKELMRGRRIKISALYAAIATYEYYKEELDAAFIQKIDAEKIRIEGDGCCLISGMLGHNDGASLICGTGSSLYMRKGDDYKHIGGGGHLIDSCGSGFSIGRLALQAALRADDGSSFSTSLCEKIEAKAGGEKPWKTQTEVYAKGRAYVASFANTVFEARREGDVAARRIFNTCVADMADVVFAARKEMPAGTTLVLNGGIFKSFPEYAEAVKALSPSDINIILSDVPPIYGCAVEALHDIGIKADESFKQAFIRTYESFL